jgi:hypothetical protein
MVKSGAEGMDADMDYFNIWPAGGSSNVFDQVTKERFTRSKRDVVYTEPFIHGFIVHWYLPASEVERRASELTLSSARIPLKAAGTTACLWCSPTTYPGSIGDSGGQRGVTATLRGLPVRTADEVPSLRTDP